MYKYKARRAYCLALVLVFMLSLVVMAGASPAYADMVPEPREPGVSCPSGAVTRVFDIAAIRLKIVINRAGEHDPDGLMYVLKEDEQRIRRLVKDNLSVSVDEVRPLVIRANAGDCIEVNFENKLDFPASIHIQGVRYDVLDSDGAAAGYNPSSVAQPGETVRYR